MKLTRLCKLVRVASGNFTCNIFIGMFEMRSGKGALRNCVTIVLTKENFHCRKFDLKCGYQA